VPVAGAYAAVVRHAGIPTANSGPKTGPHLGVMNIVDLSGWKPMAEPVPGDAACCRRAGRRRS